MEIKNDRNLRMTAEEFGDGFESDVIGGAIVSKWDGYEWEWVYMRKNGEEYVDTLSLPGALSIRMAKFVINKWFDGYDCGLQEGEEIGRDETRREVRRALGI